MRKSAPATSVSRGRRSPLTHPVVTLQPSGIFVTDVESLAHHHHHHRGLSAVTFVPEWNSLIVSVLLFSSSSPSGLCPLPTYVDASFDIYPHSCETKSGLFVSNHRNVVDLWDRRLAM